MSTQVEDIGYIWLQQRGKVTISLLGIFQTKAYLLSRHLHVTIVVMCLTSMFEKHIVFVGDQWSQTVFIWTSGKISYQKGTVYTYFPKKMEGAIENWNVPNDGNSFKLDVRGFLKITQRIWGILLHGLNLQLPAGHNGHPTNMSTTCREF